MKRLSFALNIALILLIGTVLGGCAGASSNDNNSSGGNSGGNNGNNTPTPSPTTVGTYLKASNTDSGDLFGSAVAISNDGNTIAVGAPMESSNATGVNGNQGDNSLAQSGAVYVYTRGTSGWAQQAYIKASNPGLRDEFGFSVALSADGNTLAVGAVFEDSSAFGINGSQSNDNATDSGAVYVFSRSGTTWTQQAYVKASNTEAHDSFGLALSLSGDGNALAVTAPLEDSNATGVNGNQGDNSAGDAGAVYLFARNGTTWTQTDYVKASNTQSGDGFGTSIGISSDGNTLAVGARYEDSNATGVNGNQSDNSTAESGAVYIFARSGVTWGQQAYVKASNTGAGDWFGISVTVGGDGNNVAVGACCEDSKASGLNGDQADNSASGAGAVYLFSRAAGVWSQQVYMKASTNATGSEFGHPVMISSDGNTIVSGASRENSLPSKGASDQSLGLSGAGYVITRSGTTWNYQKFLKATNADANDAFGYAVAVSADGATVVIGAPHEASASTQINTNSGDNTAGDAGAAYVF